MTEAKTRIPRRLKKALKKSVNAYGVWRSHEIRLDHVERFYGAKAKYHSGLNHNGDPRTPHVGNNFVTAYRLGV